MQGVGKKYHANPIYPLTYPMEVTAVIMVALAKSEGEMTSNQKHEIKSKFKDVFHLTEEKGLRSSDILIVSAKGWS
jgi:hypothetical protein